MVKLLGVSNSLVALFPAAILVVVAFIAACRLIDWAGARAIKRMSE